MVPAFRDRERRQGTFIWNKHYDDMEQTTGTPTLWEGPSEEVKCRLRTEA